ERKQQRQHLIAKGQPRQHDADGRVNEAYEDYVGPICPEIAETSDQDVPEIGGLDLANRGHRAITALLAAPYGAIQQSHGHRRKPGLIEPHSIGFRMCSAIIAPPEPESKARSSRTN